MSAKKLLTKDERKDAALKVAIQIAKKVGAKRVSLAAVAEKQGVTAPLLFHIFESREGFTKAIIKAAKTQGVELPDAVPTVREARDAARKAAGKKLKPIKGPLAKLKAPVKPTPAKKAPKKLAALLSPKVNKSGKVTPLKKPAKLPINVVKAIKNKEAAKAAAVPTRKPLTAEQRAAKAQRDRARRNPTAVPTTPAGKFAALPKPFEAAIQQVA